MSAFRSALDMRDNGDGKTFTLLAPLVYDSDLVGEIIVPAGAVTDLASIPLLSNHRTWSKGAVVHDWLYQRNGISRALSDRVLGEAMVVLAVPAWRRLLVLATLKAFGWRAWNRHRARDAQGVA